MAELDMSFVVTQAGLGLINRVITGQNITFKRVAIGDGYDDEISNYANRTELVNEVLSLTDLTMISTSSENVELIAKFSQADTEAEFWNREVGIYVVDPDNIENEILYAYGNKGAYAEFITPHCQNIALDKTLKFEIYVGSTANVNIYIAESSKSTVVEFDTSDWTYNSTDRVYELQIGDIQESIKIFRKNGTTKTDTALVDITRNSGNVTMLKALSPFIGCVVSV